MKQATRPIGFEHAHGNPQTGPAAARRLTPLAALLVGVVACSGTEPPTSDQDEEDVVPQVEVPAADGPKLVVLQPEVAVRERPAGSGKVLGYLRTGARVARSTEPYSKKGCDGGWYAIRPRGWVCAGADVSLDLESPIARALPGGPAIDRPMPYRYARVRRGAAVVYGALPSLAEQLAAEPKLKKRSAPEPSRMGTGPNDVPLHAESHRPQGPPVLLPDAEGVGSDGYRTTATFFRFADSQTLPDGLSVGTALRPDQIGKTEVLKRHSGVALARAFTVGEDGNAREFGVTADGRFVPVDRLRPAPGSAWHGMDISEIGLPVGFTLRPGVCPYALEGTKRAERLDDELEPRFAVALTGRFRTVNGVRFYATSDDRWLRHKDIIFVPKRNKFPDFAGGDQTWLDISLANQTLVAYAGKKPLLATLISSGQDRLGDPNEGPATAQGVFKIRSKFVSRNVDDREVGQAYAIADAPWVAEFAEGFALTASYWQRDFGEARSYHNIALSPLDAFWIWQWSEPRVPDGWHGVVAQESDRATVVYTHR
jgi:hypothetical protein